MDICIKQSDPVSMKKTAETIIRSNVNPAIPLCDNDDVLILDGNTWQDSDLETMLTVMRPKFVIFDDIRTHADKVKAQDAARSYRNTRIHQTQPYYYTLTAIYILHYE